MDVHLFTLRTVQIQKPMVKRNLCGVYVAVHVGGRGTLATGRKFRQIPKNSLKDISQIKYKKGRDFQVLETVKVASKRSGFLKIIYKTIYLN